jgi:hypothetical protein
MTKTLCSASRSMVFSNAMAIASVMCHGCASMGSEPLFPWQQQFVLCSSSS